ncbi:MAG: putative cation-transporting ATPase, partial [Blastococcus sp.]|nr:putative cation-transporting ATPase [Blastococcus sp.]
MSHTPTCHLDGHTDTEQHTQPEPARLASRVPSLLAPAPRRIAARAARVTSFLGLPEVRWAALSLAAFLLALLTGALGAPDAVQGVLFAACYVAGGWEPALAGLQALREKTLDVDILMIVAALGAAAIGQVLDGGMLIVIFATSGALEAVATKRTQDSVRSLLSLTPEEATRLRPEGTEEVVEVADLVPGDLVLVRPGERIGADGQVVDGASDVDQASITGEPLPVARTAGDEVFAGTVNGTGALRMRVGTAAADSVVARIVAMVERASETKATRQLFIEKVEQRYSVGVVMATLALFGIPLAFGEDLTTSLLRAMTFMIVASPCALVLATMPPLLSAIANAGRYGVLVKSAVVMEQLADTSAVALDKTGTLTTGRPTVVAVRPLPAGPCDEDDLLALAASAEAPSEHPLGRAVVAAARERGIDLRPVTDFRAEVGRGVTATVAGSTVTVTAPGDHLDVPALAAMVDGEQSQGRTAVVVALDGRPAGLLALADRIRPEAAATVAALREATGAEPLLLTGDNPRAATALAAAAGVGQVRAGLLPEDKVTAVRELQAAGQRVLLVGDGVNDSPALATADVGVAMGGVGSDLALSSADVVVVRDDLATLPAVVALSRRARRVIVQNLVFAAAVICALVLVDLFGHLPLPLGVLGHEGSTVVVGLNGLRMLSGRAWRPSGPAG